jgi:hemerythrin
MIDLAYPELESHRREHRQLLASIDDKAYQFNHGALDGNEFVDFTFEWFALHTTQVDRKIAAFVDRQSAD